MEIDDDPSEHDCVYDKMVDTVKLSNGECQEVKVEPDEYVIYDEMPSLDPYVYPSDAENPSTFLGVAHDHTYAFPRITDHNGRETAVICFYCDKYVKTTGMMRVVPGSTEERHDLFVQFAAGAVKIVRRMELQYQRLSNAPVFCRAHVWGYPIQKVFRERNAIARWRERAEDDEKGLLMNYYYAQQNYGYNMSSNLMDQTFLRCCYCNKHPWYKTCMPSSDLFGSRKRTRWLQRLSGGHKKVEDYLRLCCQSSATKAVTLCGDHFLRSSFVFCPEATNARLRIRPGEEPVADMSTVARLLAYIETEDRKISASLNDEAPEKASLKIKEGSKSKLECSSLEPPTMVRIRNHPHTGLRYFNALYQLDITEVEAESMVVKHRFIGKTPNKLICIACEVVQKQIAAVFEQNMKLWTTVHRRKCSLVGLISPYAAWMSDNKKWLRTQFNFKVHEFAAKAKVVWDKLPQEKRQPYYVKFEQEKLRRETKRIMALKEAEQTQGLRPELVGHPVAQVEVVAGYTIGAFRRLDHLCVRAKREFNKSYYDEKERYRPPPMDLYIYKPTQKEIDDVSSRTKKWSARKRRLADSDSDECYDDEE